MEVTLTAATKDDAEIIFNSWGKNHNNFIYLSAKPQHSIEDAKEYLQKHLSNPENLIFHIKDDETGKVMGMIKAVIEGHKAQIGYVVDESHWNRGIASKALMEIISILNSKEGISRIWATCAVDNPASRKVLEKCGFKNEAILKKWIIYPSQGSQAHDNYSYVWDNYA